MIRAKKFDGLVAARRLLLGVTKFPPPTPMIHSGPVDGESNGKHLRVAVGLRDPGGAVSRD